ncbi:hypothetical protein P7C71_g1638, partial [Lecanoromycetidae sp. Uapishka_2]
MAGNRQIEDPGRALHYIAPTATLLFYLVATFISVVTLQNLKGVDRRVPRKTLLLIMSSVPVSYTIEAALLLADSFAIESGQSSVDGNIYALSNILVWVTLTASLKADCRVWYPHYGSWLIALFTEAILFILILNRGSLSTVIGFVQAIIRACRVVVLILLLTVLFAKTSNTVAIDEESDSLLGNGNGKRSTNGATSPTNLTYGATSTPSDTDDVDSDDDDDDYDKKRKKEKMELQAQVQAKATSNAAYKAYFSLFLHFNATEETIIDLGLTGAALLAIYQIVYGNQPIGNFAMLISYWGNFTGSLWYLVGAQRQVLKSLVDAEALLKLFQKIPTIRDGPQAFEYKSGSVDFCDVDFSYDGKKNIIKNFSFHANPGQRVALVGETGGGKSTILKLLFRFYDAKNGSVMIDGQNVKDLTMETLRRSIGVVPQDPSMFNDTVMENVRYSNPGAADTDVIEACKAAAVHEKILSFPKGYATRVGEGGVKLSGGELQRIAIARVILQNPNIILLDEATSAVDSETEAQIQGALERLTRGRTTFTVAHRLSTITNSDIVLVIKSGEIIEQGSPKVLLEAKGKYHDLWLRQIGVYKVAEEEGTEAEPDDDPKA